MSNSTLCSKLHESRLKAKNVFQDLVSRGEQVEAETLSRLQDSSANQRLREIRERLQALLQPR